MPEPAASQVRLCDLVVGLSLVADLGMGLEPGDAARACLVATRLADRLDLADRPAVYYTSLLQHCGCTAFSHEAAALLGGDDIAAKSAGVLTDYSQPREVVGTFLLGLAPDAGPLTRLRTVGSAILRSDRIRSGYSLANCEVAAAIARRVGLGAGVEQGLAQIFEQWDGAGRPHGLVGDDVSIAARCAQVAGAAALFDRLGGADGAKEALRRRRGRSLDPGLVDAYLTIADDVHAELADTDPLQAALAAEPGPPMMASEDLLDPVCQAFGDAVDLKSIWFHGHSAGVAALSKQAASVLGLPAPEGRRLRWAGHLMDLGRAAVPTGIWEKDRALTQTDWERVRLHAYHSERILARCAPLASLAPLVGMHHERLDGSGYHRAAAASGLGISARILAAADTFQALIEPRAHRAAVTAEQAGDLVSAQARAGRLDPDAAAAVLAAAGLRAHGNRPSRTDGLTDRQVEVLRLLAAGLSNPEIARRLVVSRRTAEHHVQDIYARIGLNSRAAAALYAMEHQLLG